MKKKKSNDKGQKIEIRKDKNLTSYFLLLAFCFLPLVSVGLSFAASEEAQIYFGAAKEKYIQGDFDSAISNIEKAIALDSENKKIKAFGSRIFYDGAKSLHASRNYKKAFTHLEKAIKLNPGDARIRRLYDVTKDLLERAEPKVEIRERVSARPPLKKEAVPVNRAPARAPAVVKREVAPAPPAETPIIPSAEYFTILAVSFSLSVIMIITAFFLFLRTRKLKKEISHKLAELEGLKSEKIKIVVEFEKVKELLRREQSAVSKLQREIKDEMAIKNKHLEQQLKLSMDIKQKQFEETIKASLSKKESTELFSRQAKVLELIGDATHIDEGSSVALDAARERISVQSAELLKESKKACLDFLKKMSTNPNYLIRANIVRSLSELALPDTIKLLFDMLTDRSEQVKREVLKELKRLKTRTMSGEVILDKKIVEELEKNIQDEIKLSDWIF